MLISDLEKRFIEDYMELAGIKGSDNLRISKITYGESTCSLCFWEYQTYRHKLIKELDDLKLGSFSNLADNILYKLDYLGIKHD